MRETLAHFPGEQLRQLGATRTILVQKPPVLLQLTAVEPHDGGEVLHLPGRPLIERGTDGGVVTLRVDEQYLVLKVFAFALVEEPERTGKALGVEEVVADVEHDVDDAALDQLAALGLLTVRVGRRRCHDEARAAAPLANAVVRLLQVGEEIVNPQVVGSAGGDLALLVLLGDAQR